MSKIDAFSDEYIAKQIILDFQKAYGDPTSQIVHAKERQKAEGWNIGDVTDEVLTARPRILEIVTNAFIGKHRGQSDSYGETILPSNPNFEKALTKARDEIRMIRSLLLGKL